MASVCVFCASSEAIDQKYRDLAAALGKRLAAGGHSLVSGGGRVSMMGALARAARDGGAHTVGVIPRHLMAYEVADRDADELVVVETMRDRKRVMDERSDAFVVLPGGIGTLEEFFEIWTSGTLGMHAKPVIVVDDDGYYQPLWDFVESLARRGFVRHNAIERLRRVATVDEAVEIIEES